MKKTYIKPTIVSFEIEAEQLMQASLTFEKDNSKGLGGLNVVGAEENSMSKGHSFDLWADDEED